MKEANGFSQWFLSLCRVASGFKQYSQGKGVPTTAQVPSKICYRKVPKVKTFESSDKISQVLSNLESSDHPENNDPPKEETSNQISLFGKKITERYDRYPEQMPNPMFINNDYLTVPIHNS